jgi:selenium metabolism protein YedF
VSGKKELMIVIRSSGFGEGEPDLGEKLLKSFLQMFLNRNTIPDLIIFLNSGIFLTTKGTPLEDIIREFESKGTEILSCGTCLDYFERRDKLVIGQPTNMKDTVDAIMEYKKVITV